MHPSFSLFLPCFVVEGDYYCRWRHLINLWIFFAPAMGSPRVWDVPVARDAVRGSLVELVASEREIRAKISYVAAATGYLARLITCRRLLLALVPPPRCIPSRQSTAKKRHQDRRPENLVLHTFYRFNCQSTGVQTDFFLL